MAADAAAAGENAASNAEPKMTYLQRKDPRYFHLIVESYGQGADRRFLVQLPFHILVATPDELCELYRTKNLGAFKEGKKLWTVKGNVATRILTIGKDDLPVEKHFILRSMRGNKVAKAVPANELSAIIDSSFPDANDLASFEGLLLLFRDKVQGLMKKPLKLRQAVAGILQELVYDLFYAWKQADINDLVWNSAHHEESYCADGHVQKADMEYLMANGVMSKLLKSGITLVGTSVVARMLF